MPLQVDTYAEREMFSALFPLVGAWPTPEVIAAVMPVEHRFHDVEVVRRELGDPGPGHGLRRRSSEAWSTANTVVVPIPDELLDAHQVEVADVRAHPPTRSTHARSVGFFDAYRDAQLGLLRRRIEVDPERWAHDVAHGNEREMIALAEHTRDWGPWIPLINFAMFLRELDDSLVLRAAEHRLRLIARRLLDAPGLHPHPRRRHARAAPADAARRHHAARAIEKAPPPKSPGSARNTPALPQGIPDA